MKKMNVWLTWSLRPKSFITILQQYIVVNDILHNNLEAKVRFRDKVKVLLWGKDKVLLRVRDRLKGEVRVRFSGKVRFRVRGKVRFRVLFRC